MPTINSFHAARLRPRRHLGVRSRQHALSASPQSLAAGRRPHPRLRRRLPESVEGRGLPRAEGLLQALRHHHARADDRARLEPDDYLDFVHQIDHSPLEPNPALGAALEKLPGRKLILTNGTRKHADAVMRRLEIAPAFRGRVRHRRRRARAEAAPQDLRAVSRAHDVDRDQGRDVRGSRAQSGSAARARHDHGAGGAGRPARGVPRGSGSWKAATRPCRSRHRRSRRLSRADRRAPLKPAALARSAAPARQARCRQCRHRSGAASTASLRGEGARERSCAASATALWMTASPTR